MSEPVDTAFSAFVSARLVGWINGRIGEGQWSREGLDGPRLDCETAPGVFTDDQGQWFRPEFAVLRSDPAFSFVARQTAEVDEDGDPFNRATLTLSLSADAPTSGATSAAARVPDFDIAVNLIVPTVAPDGSVVTNRVHGSVSASPDGDAFIVSFDLKGAEVIATYVHLTQRDPGVAGGVTFQIIASHLAVQPATSWPAHVALSLPFPMSDVSFDIPGPTFDGLQFFMVGPEGQSFGAIPQLPAPFGAVPASVRYLPIIARYDRTVAVGETFSTDEYRSRFTIARDDMTRPIVDANDLSEFAGPRSEYRELTSLGIASARYPSLQRLYFGQVSGTVVAVPAAYGIQRTASGPAARCDAIVDAASITGSRFHFTFAVAPLVDPVELAQLSVDVAGLPEAVGRSLQVTLPTGLDTRNPSNLSGFSSALASFAGGSGSEVHVSVDLADDQGIPSTTLVNQFVNQLGAKAPAPLFGTIAVRLDDMFPQPVQARLALNLHETADGDDVTATPVAAGIEVANASPFALTVERLAITVGDAVIVRPLAGQVLAGGQSLVVSGNTTGVTNLAVSRDFPLPSPVPKADMLNYVSFNTVAVEQVQFPLTVNATGVSFAAAGISTILVQFAVTKHPTIAVPSLTLSGQHAVDFTHVLVPVVASLAGLEATVVLEITTPAGPRHVSLTHDFVDEPILLLTDAAIA